MSQDEMNEDFKIVSGIEDTVVVTTSGEQDYEKKVERAVKDYLNNPRYASVFEPDTNAYAVTLARIDELATDPQNSIDKTRQIAKIVDKYINKNYLIGMVDTVIRSNLNTNYKVSYNQVPSETGRNTKNKLKAAKEIVEKMLDEIDIKKLIRLSIPCTFDYGNYFFYMETDKDKYNIHIFPLSIARIAPYRLAGEPILMIDMDELRNRLEHNLPKRKGGKAYFFEKYENEITQAYPKEIVDAFRNKEKYAILDYKRTGIMRAGEDRDGASLYGVSHLLRALRDIVILDKFADVDDTASNVRAKNILVQTLRKELLGPDGGRQTIKEAAFAHGELCRAVKQKTCVYTGIAAVEDVKWIEPKSNLIDVQNVSLYENRVLSTLGIGFLAKGSASSTLSATISLKQLMRQINYISQQLEHIIEKFAVVALQQFNIPPEYAPKIMVIDSEQLEAEMRIEFAKFLYGTLGASRRTVFEAVNIDLNDETERRAEENAKNLDEIFKPYMTAYTNNGEENENNGRPADNDSKDEEKQGYDKERNGVSENNE